MGRGSLAAVAACVGLMLAAAPSAGAAPVFEGAFGSSGSGEGQLFGPIGLDGTEGGDVLVADIGNLRLQRFDPEGEYLSEFGTFGFAPTDVALDSEEHAWVSLREIGCIAKLGLEGSEELLAVACELQEPTGLDVDSEDHVWVAETGAERVHQFGPGGESVSQFGESGTEEGELKEPAGLALDPAGDVWVADTGNDRVQQFDAEGQYMTQLGAPSEEEQWEEEEYEEDLSANPGRLKAPVAIAIDDDGDLWVADTGNDRVQRFSPQGEFLTQFGEEGAGEAQFEEPSGIGLDSAGGIWVADTGNDRIHNWTFTQRPGVLSGAAGGIGSNQATLNATVNPKGIEVDECNFEYGTSSGYGKTVPCAQSPESIGSGAEPVAVHAEVSGLEATTIYHFRIVARNKDGVSQGDDQTFATITGPPVATTSAAGLVQPQSASLHAIVNPSGLPTTYGFEFGETTAYGSTVPGTPYNAVGFGTQDVNVVWTPGGLEPETTYHFRVVASNEKGDATGEDKVFTTGARVPKVESESAISLGPFRRVLRASVNPEAADTTYRFEYGNTTSYGSVTPVEPEALGSGTEFTQVSETVADLQPATEYHARIVASSEHGSVYGPDESFETPNLLPSFFFTAGSAGDGPGQFSFLQFEFPQGLTTDPEGNIWVADTGNNRIQKFDSDGRYLEDFGAEGTNPEQFLFPFGVAADPEGNVWVLDTGNNRIQKFDPEGGYLDDLGEEGASIGEFSFPLGLTVDPEGNIWVADTGNNRIQKFDPDGHYLDEFGEEGYGPGQFYSPQSVAADPEGNVWVLDTGNNRIQKFDSKGNYLDELGEEGLAHPQLGEPRGLATDSDGNIWIADAAYDQIKVFDAEGEYIGQRGETGSGVGQFDEPVGIAVDPSDEIWISDSSHQHLQKWARPQLGATSGSVEPVFDVDATLNGFVSPAGKEISSCAFQYGLASEIEYHEEEEGSYGYELPCAESGEAVGSGTARVPVHVDISSLQPATLYRFRVVVIRGDDEVVSEGRNFKTREEFPRTTLTSSQQSYTGNEDYPITFTSSKSGSTFKCVLEKTPKQPWDPQPEPTEPCTSPYSIPAHLSTGWHTFKVVATDEEGNTDRTPATWIFDTAPYPAAPSNSKLTSPEAGAMSGRYFRLVGKRLYNSIYPGVTFQLKLAGWDAFRTIPSSYVLDTKGNQVGWPFAETSNISSTETEAVFFDAKAYVEDNDLGAEEKFELRVAFDGKAYGAGASEPATVTYHRFAGGPTDATEEIGPAAVNLLTGAFTVARTDVSIPVPGSEANLEFTRTYNSAYAANEATNSKVLGAMWQPSAAVEAEYEEEAWQKLVVQHRDAVPAKYSPECQQEVKEYEEEWEESLDPEICLEEYAIPEQNWVEVLDNEASVIPFDKQGSNTYVAPDGAKEFKLTKPGANFILVDPNGTRTEFSQNGTSNEYQPSAVTFKAGDREVRLVYEVSEGKKRLKRVIGPAAAGVTCNPLPGEGSYAPGTAGCRTLVFLYTTVDGEGRLEKITYYDATGSSQDVSRYDYNQNGLLIKQWDPRISPNLVEQYAYESPQEARLTGITPPGVEPWSFHYYPAGSGGEYEAKLKGVSRASLLEDPEMATTTIVYDVPLSGEDAPYDLSIGTISKWAQADYPVDATAVFPPTEIPDDPAEDYTQAAVHYLDPDGYAVNTASPSPPGVEGDVIATSETDRHGNVVRELSPRNRLLANWPARARELDTHSIFNEDGTEMLESWGPVHEVRRELYDEAIEVRQHTEVKYDQGAPTPNDDEPWPHLPTWEKVSGEREYEYWGGIDQRKTETKYDWDLRKATEEIVDMPTDLRTVAVYDKDTGLVAENSQPSDPKGEDAGTTVNVYYSAGTQSPISACRNKAKWANLPCVSYPKAEASPVGDNPKLSWTWITNYNSLDLPTETQEKIDGELKRKTITAYDAAGRPVQSLETGEGIEVPPSETLYSESTGVPVGQRFICQEECEGFDDEMVLTTLDALGRPIEYADADGNVSGVAYDLLGRSAIISDGKGVQTAVYDEASGALTQIQDSAAGAFSASYDADGKIIEVDLPNGLTAHMSYDEAGSSTQLSYEKGLYCGASCTWLKFDQERSVHGQVLRQSNASGSSQEYSYDKAGRLILVKDTESGQCTTRAYSFDKNTNRTKLTTREPGEGGVCDLESEGDIQSYDYDTADRLIGEGVEYDNLGRITDLPAKYSGGGKLETSYYVNDLTRSQTQDEITNTYELDSSGRQRERVRTGGSEAGNQIYHYASGSDSPAWVDEGEGKWTRFIGALGTMAIEDGATDEVTLQLSDMHGDVVATADIDPEATELLSTQQFDEYGNPKQTNPLLGGDAEYGWLGSKSRRTQLPSGVIQMGVRSYVPAMGRFLSPDPVPGGSANAYEYAEGDPVNNFDLTGERCGGRCKKIRRQNRRSRRMARQHNLRRLARGRGRGARASSFILAPIATRLGRDVGEQAGYVAGKLADMAFRRAKQAAENEVRSKAAMVRYIMSGMNKVGDWAWAHRRQIHSCAYNAAAGYMEARYLALGGPKGAAALGLYMAVRCGIGFL